MHDVAVQVVGAGRHGRQRFAEAAGAGGGGVEMINRVHLRPADRVQVHQVAVIREQIIVGALAAAFIGDARVDAQVQRAAEKHGVQHEGVEEVGGVVGGLHVPPAVAAPDGQRQQQQGYAAGEGGTILASRRRPAARGETGLAHRAVDDAGHTHDQYQAQDREDEPQRPLHALHGKSHGGNRHAGRGGAARAVGLQPDLPGAGGHQPE